MPIKIVKGDITKIKCDAIVNATNHFLTGASGVDRAILESAGEQAIDDRIRVGKCGVAQVVVTDGRQLPCKYIFHTVGPRYQGGQMGEATLLTACYENCLKKATEYNLTSIAFPLISTGERMYPRAEALEIANKAIEEYLEREENDLLIILVLYYRKSSATSYYNENLDRYVLEKYNIKQHFTMSLAKSDQSAKGVALDQEPSQSFSDYLIRLISQSGMTNAECYKKANVDKKLFSKIISNKEYHPRKMTALAFAIALKLNLPQTKQLLDTAGYSLSRSIKADIIVEYFIINKIYNIFEINQALFDRDLPLLGSV